MKPRVIRVYQLRRGDRFTQVPAAWYGPGVVTESYGTRILQSNAYWLSEYPLTRGGKRVTGTWTVKFSNSKVVNPPGVIYCNPETRVRLLNRPRRKESQ